MSEEFSLVEYMSSGIEKIIKNIIKSSITNPKETAFVMKYMIAAKRFEDKRKELEEKGKHIPSFIMASISSNCNLYCKGCFARAIKSCSDNLKDKEVSVDRWDEIFKEAKDLGVSFILLLGGEPLLRRDVIEKAASIKEIVFPIFTNGTMIDESYMKLFDKNRNLFLMLSIEGNRKQTDNRRGIGTYNMLISTMEKMNRKGILFGGSITITTENLETVTSIEFIKNIYNKGARAVTFVEYVPVTKNTEVLALGDKERIILESNIEVLRREFKDMVLLSFPGDEKHSGGCLAGGRGFFHINSQGNAEPCPFSPYSDVNLKDSKLEEALMSPLFKKLNESNMLIGEHDGGCLLFAKEEEVKSLLK